jgi:CheY-like chemotaxis protein
VGRTAELEQALEDQRRLEAVANDANRTKSEFLSRMSHELRTPLNAVLGFAQLLETEPLEPEQLDSVHQIRRGGRHLLDLINEVLDLTRIETGTIALSPEAVPVGDVVAEAIELLGALAASSNVHLVGDTAHTCDVHVFADRQRLKQILLNLLSNAIKYNRPGGTVSAHCAAAGDRLRIKVVDTGPGISEADAARLFQPFERLGAEHTEVQGTGIGLALSRRLAVAMGGSVDVESVVGRGSTFWVELPIVEGPVQRYERLDVRRASASADDDPDTRTVLYIEDNVSNLRLVERVLEKRPQIHLVAAMQGRLGLDLARQHRPFAILLDLHLPDCEGEDVLHQLRDDPATASIPVVILSADATPGRIQRLVAAGAHAYLAKPLDVRRLLETLDDLLLSAT